MVQGIADHNEASHSAQAVFNTLDWAEGGTLTWNFMFPSDLESFASFVDWVVTHCVKYMLTSIFLLTVLQRVSNLSNVNLLSDWISESRAG